VTIVGATYAPDVPLPAWALGDFDYNGFVDDDATMLGAFYDAAAGPLSAPFATGDSMWRAEPGAGVAAAANAVPEPSTMVLVAALLAVVGFLRTRRKR
jgi:hypothetical protein